jgi:hypothetical protein
MLFFCCDGLCQKVTVEFRSHKKKKKKKVKKKKKKKNGQTMTSSRGNNANEMILIETKKYFEKQKKIVDNF